MTGDSLFVDLARTAGHRPGGVFIPTRRSPPYYWSQSTAAGTFPASSRWQLGWIQSITCFAKA